MQISTKFSLRILHLEDNEVDAEIIRRQLDREAIHAQIIRVETESEFRNALTQDRFDLILADRMLATFGGFEALEIAIKNAPDVPFIFVSGTLGEELAVGSLLQGATDYVLKDHLNRLGPAVRRALSEAAERKLRKEADEKLHQNRQELADFFEHAPIGLNWTDAEGRILKTNRAELDLYGYTAEEYVGRFLAEFHEDTKALEKAFAQVAQGQAIHNFEARIRRKDGQIKTVVMQINGLWENGKFIHARSFTLDVTARLELESQLQQSRKMESVGQLASGIAHDFNNLLAVIAGHAKVILARENLQSEISEPVREISEAAKRAAVLTRELLAFSRKQTLNMQASDLNHIIANISKMLRHILGRKTELKLDLGARLPAVNIDVGAIEKVLVNLAFNSRDAMPDGGQARLSTSVFILDQTQAEPYSGATPGQYVRLTFSDTGCGISQENLPRIFEPFFTTKELDRGTGLGLATVYGIIKQHRGWIQVESKVGKGTSVHVFLPEWGRMSQSFLPGYNETAEFLAGKADYPHSLGGTETILVVEKETPLRDLIRHVLETRGYKVVEASAEREALEIGKIHNPNIDLLLIDPSQTESGGQKLAQTLRGLKPGLKIIYMSEPEAGKINSSLEICPDAFLQKPFHARKLAETIYNCLIPTRSPLNGR